MLMGLCVLGLGTRLLVIQHGEEALVSQRESCVWGALRCQIPFGPLRSCSKVRTPLSAWLAGCTDLGCQDHTLLGRLEVTLLARGKRLTHMPCRRVRALEATLAQLSASHAPSPGDPPPVQTAEEDAAGSSQPLVASLGAELPAAGAQTAAATAAQTAAATATATAAPTAAQTAAGGSAGDRAPAAEAHDGTSGSGLQQGPSAAPLLQVEPADVNGGARSDTGSAPISLAREAAAPLQQPTQPSGAAGSPAAAASPQQVGGVSLTGSSASGGGQANAAPQSPQQRGAVLLQEAFGSPAAVEVLSGSSDGPGGAHSSQSGLRADEWQPATLASPEQQQMPQAASHDGTALAASSPGCEPALPGAGSLAESQHLEPRPHEAAVPPDTGMPPGSQPQGPAYPQSMPQGAPQARPVSPPKPQEAP